MRRIELIYNLTIGLFWFAAGLPSATVVLYMQSRGLSLSDIGLLMGAFAVTTFLLEVPTGGLADSLGRKRVSLIAYSILMLKQFVFVIAFGFPLFLLARILQGAGSALNSGALDAWFVDALKDKDPNIDLQPPLARADIVSYAAIAAGSLVGGWLPQRFAMLSEATLLTPLNISFILSGLFYVAVIVLLVIYVEDKDEEKQPFSRKAYSQTLRAAIEKSFKTPRLLLLLAGTSVAGFALSGVETLWQPAFTELLGNEATQVLGMLLSLAFLIGMLGNVIAIQLNKLFQKRYALLAGIAQGVSGVCLLGLGISGNVVLAGGLFWFYYLSRSIAESPSAALFNESIEKDTRASMLSIKSLVMYLGYFLGSTGLGYVADLHSFSLAWLLAGSGLVLSVYFYVRIHYLTDNPKGKE